MSPVVRRIIRQLDRIIATQSATLENRLEQRAYDYTCGFLQAARGIRERIIEEDRRDPTDDGDDDQQPAPNATAAA